MTRKPHSKKPRRPSPPSDEPVVGLRIIGGHHRGRKLEHSGDPRTRPMKDRVREATFNRLGTAVRDKLVLDLFAGTGACGLEALSRGAAAALFLEQHRPTADVISRNVKVLELGERVTVTAAETFTWLRAAKIPTERPWLSFVCPPYELYQSAKPAMLELVRTLTTTGPAGSLIVLESDERFDWNELPDLDRWDVRPYPPAVIGIYD